MIRRPLVAVLFALLAIQTTEAQIARSRAEVYAFRQLQVCPATGRRHGACPGWQVDHIIPLCAGGLDRPANMHWLSIEDHRFKTLVDARECRKLARLANQPARAAAHKKEN